jgi:hypothetical protein
MEYRLSSGLFPLDFAFPGEIWFIPEKREKPQ